MSNGNLKKILNQSPLTIEKVVKVKLKNLIKKVRMYWRCNSYKCQLVSLLSKSNTKLIINEPYKNINIRKSKIVCAETEDTKGNENTNSMS